MRFIVFGLLLLTTAYIAESRSLASYYEDDALETQILQEVNDLYDNTKKAIDTLSKSGKDELVKGLETAIAFVQSIDSKVKELKPTTDLGKELIGVVNVLIKNGEDILNNELKNAKAGTTSTEDYKPKLVSEVKAVYEKAKAAFDALQKSDKKTLKEALTTVVGIEHELQTELNALKPSTDIGKAVFSGVQKLVNDVVTYLELQLKTIGDFYEEDPIETALSKQVEDLYDNAKKAIDTLSKSGKTELVNGLEKSIAFVKSIEDKVKTLAPTTDLGKAVVELVDKLIAKGEDILNDNLKNAQAGTTSTADNKAALVAIVKEVYEKAKTAYETLAKSDKKTLKDGLTKVIEVGKQIGTELTALNPTTDIGKALFQGIQSLITEVVTYLEAELKAVGDYYEDDALETQVLQEVNDLYDNTKKAIDTLSKSGKDELVKGLETAIAFVQSIDSKVTELKPTTDLGKALIEAVNVLIKNGENILNTELKNAKAGTTSTEDYKPHLVSEVKAVYEKAKAAFDALQKSDQKTLKEALTTVVGIGHELQTELNALKPSTDVGKAVFSGVQKLVNDVVTYLELQLKSIGN